MKFIRGLGELGDVVNMNLVEEICIDYEYEKGNRVSFYQCYSLSKETMSYPKNGKLGIKDVVIDAEHFEQKIEVVDYLFEKISNMLIEALNTSDNVIDLNNFIFKVGDKIPDSFNMEDVERYRRIENLFDE